MSLPSFLPTSGRLPAIPAGSINQGIAARREQLRAPRIVRRELPPSASGETTVVSPPAQPYDPRGSLTAQVRNCSDDPIYQGQVLGIIRPAGDRWSLSFGGAYWFDRPADPTPPADPTEPPPADTERHVQEVGGPFAVAPNDAGDQGDAQAGVGPHELKRRTSVPDRGGTLLGDLFPTDTPIYAPADGRDSDQEITEDQVLEAVSRLDYHLARMVAVANEDIAPGDVGECVVWGHARALVYVGDPAHERCGPYRGDVTRVVAKRGEATDAVVGHLGRYSEGPGSGGEPGLGDAVPEGAISETVDGVARDPSKYYLGRPQFLWSDDDGPVRILHAYRRDNDAEQPLLPYASVEYVKDVTAPFADGESALDLTVLGVPFAAGNSLALVVNSETRDNTAGAGPPVEGVDVARMVASGWKVLLDETQRVVASDETYWLHTVAFVRGVPRATDGTQAHLLDHAERLNAYASLVEFRGADVNRIVATSSASNYASPATGERVNTPGEVYSQIQVSHGYEE